MFIRFIFIFTSFLLAVSISNSETDKPDNHNDIKISFGYRQSLVSFKNAGQANICFEFFIDDNISLDYSIAGNLSSENTFLHAPLGLVGGLSLLSETWETDFSTYDYLILLLMLIPEGINFYIPMNDIMNVVPYFHPLGYDYVIDDYSATSTVGVKLEFEPVNRVSLNPFAGIKYFYNHHTATLSFDIGLLIGVKF